MLVHVYSISNMPGLPSTPDTNVPVGNEINMHNYEYTVASRAYVYPW